MGAGGALDIAQRIAGHSQLSTTKLYDRSQDRVTIAEIERVSFELSWEPHCGERPQSPPENMHIFSDGWAVDNGRLKTGRHTFDSSNNDVNPEKRRRRGGSSFVSLG